MTTPTALSERECGWCRVAYVLWREIRCIETSDDMVFCSAICLENWEAATGRPAEIVSELPFQWNRSEIGYECLPSAGRSGDTEQ